MPLEAWLMFLSIGGFVWGGFIAFLIRAFRSEAAKERRDSRREA